MVEAVSSEKNQIPCVMATWATPMLQTARAAAVNALAVTADQKRPQPRASSSTATAAKATVTRPTCPVSQRSVASAAIPDSTTASASVVARANDTLLAQSRNRLTASVSRKRSVRPSRSPANAAAATAKAYRHVHPMAIAASTPFRASLPK